jgi:gamma-glutamyltranspeptidase
MRAKTRDDEASFLQDFAERRRTVIRPVFEAAGAMLEERGHRVRQAGAVGLTQAINLMEGHFVGVHDPRVRGRADGPGQD